MHEIKLTGTLKTYKAIVVYPGNQIPEFYIPFMDAEVDEDLYIIAVPADFEKNKKIWKRLADQSFNCLFNSLPGDSSITFGVY